MVGLFKSFHLSWHSFVGYLPELLGGMTCFLLTLFFANFAAKIVSRYSLRRTKDSLIANFIGKIAWSVIFIMGTVLAPGILGLGTIFNKILSGAGITTFVVGFALKDIGENFLAGLILAFSRPYRVGNLIECVETKGVVKDMAMRQTTVEASVIIKQAIGAFAMVMHAPDAPIKVLAEGLSGEKIKLLVIYWLHKAAFKGSLSETRSGIMLAVLTALSEKDIKYSD